MGPCPHPSKFAPAERVSRQEVLRQHQAFRVLDGATMLDALPGMVLVLNRQRQLVFANLALLRTLGISVADVLLGRRPGELFNCIYSGLEEGGCGTSEFCQQCGAVNSILRGLAGVENSQECRLLYRGGHGMVEALDLLVTSSPYCLGTDGFVIFSLQDISHEKRRRVLERFFFHDLLNLTGALQGFLNLFREHVRPEGRDDLDLVSSYFLRINEEILAHKELMAAECHELSPRVQNHDSDTLLQNLAEVYRRHDVCEGRRLEVEPCHPPVRFATDRALWERVMGNMLKNALENTPTGGVVRMGCRPEGLGRVLFWVRNEEVMPLEVQKEIFKRSFSTKGTGRGLGTYSIKVFGEQYLGGRVWFQSEPGEGTTFHLSLPLTGPTLPC